MGFIGYEFIHDIEPVVPRPPRDELGTPTVYFSGGSQPTTWTIPNTDESTTIDWEGRPISESNNHVYVAEILTVLP